MEQTDVDPSVHHATSTAAAVATSNIDAEDRDLEHQHELIHTPLLSDNCKRVKHAPRGATRSVQPWKIAVVMFVFAMLAIHVLFVVLLRKTTVSLEQLTIPDLCHMQSKGAAVLQFANPSYCTPEVGPLRVVFAKNGTAVLELALPRFALASGESTLVTDVDFTLLVSPTTLHALVFRDASSNLDIAGSVPIRIYCLLVPFTVHVNVQNAVLATAAAYAAHNAVLPSPHTLSLDPTPALVQSLTQSTSIKHELEHLVARILSTIALAHIRVERDTTQLFAYTDVSFDYSARVLWNVPALTIQVASAANERILRAGFQRFLLGNGHTFISAFTAIALNETAPLQQLLQQYLTGTDVMLHVSGANVASPSQSCYSLEVLELVDVRVRVPATIDGQPTLLRHAEVHPTLKELDSHKRKCLLAIDVLLAVNDPLPLRFDLYGVALDLLYKSARHSASATFLLHLDDHSHTSWAPHRASNVTLTAHVSDYAACSAVIGLYFKDDLAFEIQHGRIQVGVGSGNLTIPFTIKQIDIHPSDRSSLGGSIVPNAGGRGDSTVAAIASVE